MRTLASSPESARALITPPASRGPWLARRLTLLRAKTLVALADALGVSIAAALCVVFVPVDGPHVTRESAAPVLAVAPAVWLFALARQRAYRARNIARRSDEFRRVVRASGTSLALLAIIGEIVGRPFARGWFVALPIGAVVLLMAEREIARRVFIGLRRKGGLRRPVVVVGANQEAIEIARVVSRDPSIGYGIVGFVSDLDLDRIDESIRNDVLGMVADIDEVVVGTGARGVVIASTAVTTQVSNRLARQLTERGLHVEITSTLRDIAVERLTVGEVGSFPTVYVEAVQRGGWRAGAKRVFDCTVAVALGIVLAPMLALTAVLVKLTSPGPVLFRQTRIGLDGRLFELVKFRTMHADAELRLPDVIDLNEASGPLFKIAEDPRVTRLGRLLRRTSLDELPQLWNVLRGEMSLVGPRPALPAESMAWAPEVRDRLRVKPGMTGMWQINGRSHTSFDDYVRLDLFYVDNWSLTTDLAVLLRTVPAVLLRRGAA